MDDREGSSSAKRDKRVHESFVSSAEMRILLAIAPRLPAWLTPNALTAIGLAGAFVVLAGYALSRESLVWLWLANAGLVINWLGDSLDGNVARIRKIERPRFGFYLDQVVDTFASLAIAIGVGISPFARLDLSLLILAIFSMLTMQTYVRTIVNREFYIAIGRLGPTEFRLGILGLNVLVLVFGAQPIAGISWVVTWVDLAMAAAAPGLILLMLVQMRADLRRLSVEDPRPEDRSS